MSRDKQIEEMAKEICSEYDCIIPCHRCAYYGYENCRDVKSAEKLYNAGYRKASDLAEEIFAEIDEIFERQIYESRWLDQNGKVLGVVDVFYAFECWRDYIKPELKKKYIGKDTNVTTNTEEK